MSKQRTIQAEFQINLFRKNTINSFDNQRGVYYNVNRELIEEISKTIYSLFVVNTAAAGIQQKNGIYITKYIPVSPFLIENMILAKGSMGCYQQGYKTGYLKWICMDFDCKDKTNPDVERLHEEIIVPVTEFLNRKGIHYLTEFSGRRGIHVWVIFDQIIGKELGFRILNEILQNIPIEQHADFGWGLDKFPATDSKKNNKVGKQVKFPLSTHRTGGMSYFYLSDFKYRNDLGTDAFFKEQFEILSNYQENSVKNTLEALGLNEQYSLSYSYKYRKYKVLDAIDLTLDEIWSVLTQTRVFSEIYSRMKRGQAIPQDWTVILGTLSPCDVNTDLLQAVFREFPNYDEEKTAKNLKQLKDRYYPASFGYLYYIYNLEIEEELDPEMTGFEYLCQHLGTSAQTTASMTVLNRVKGNVQFSIEDTINKEKEYLLYNDESPDIYIWNQLNLLKTVDRKEMQEVVEFAINNGNYKESVEPFRVFERQESEDKKRKLVSLSARDRVVTTHLALELCREYNQRWRSFSYRPSLTSRNDIFYAWYRSWSNYIDRVRTFLQVPFFDEFGIMFIDLKGFYDHIDFLAVYELLNKEISEKASNILKSLISYNDMLMTQINSGNRIGVPQGPAYARVIAEIYLNRILSVIEKQYENNIIILRYVDDITIICKPRFPYNTLFYELRDYLSRYGLPINTEKSQCYGKIRSLTKKQRMTLLHTDNFNYDLRNDPMDELLLASERRSRLVHYLEDHSFDIRSLGYIFGSKTMQEAKEWCFTYYSAQIIGSKIGRGSNFRRFYDYVFRHKEYLSTCLKMNLFELIPINSVNFSNFINTLYLVVQEQQIESQGFERIKNEYFVQIDTSMVSDNDRAVLESLKLIHLEDDDES